MDVKVAVTLFMAYVRERRSPNTAKYYEDFLNRFTEIGRASCRERV